MIWPCHVLSQMLKASNFDDLLEPYFSRTTTLAPELAICVAVERPPIPLPMITASYTMSVGASSERRLSGLLLAALSGTATACTVEAWIVLLAPSHLCLFCCLGPFLRETCECKCDYGTRTNQGLDMYHRVF